MPIDTSIYGAIQQPKPVNLLADYAGLAQLQNAQQANQLNRLKFDEAQREVDDNRAIRGELSAPGADPYNVLLRRGKVKEATEYRKAETDAKRVNSDISNKDVETEHKTIGIYRDASQSITDPQSAAEFVRMMHSDPRLKNSAIARVPIEQAIAQIPQDPAQIGAWKQQFALGATKFMELNKPTIHMQDTGGASNVVAVPGLGGAPALLSSTAKTQSPDNAATVAATIRGQDKTDARARETLAEGKTQIVQSDNGPVLVNKATGAGRVVMGPDGNPLPGVTKPLNDSQSKALLFGTRMQEADKVLGQLASEGTTASVPGSRAPVIGGAITALSSGNQQMLDQAKRDFMTAVLRRESGAAISTGEYETADKQYFPQIGDSPKVIEQKRRNRELAIKGVLVEVPEKQRASITPQAAPSSKGPTLGAVQEGYRFKGGNPADPKSWEKI